MKSSKMSNSGGKPEEVKKRKIKEKKRLIYRTNTGGIVVRINKSSFRSVAIGLSLGMGIGALIIRNWVLVVIFFLIALLVWKEF